MFQRPRTVALEYEKPGMYGAGLIPPTRPFDRVWLRGLRDNHLQLGLVSRPCSRHNVFGFPYNDIKTCFQRIRESRINLVATPRAERSSATTRRTGGDENAVKAFALPFSLDDRSND
ncbi:hypothetical protein PIB30_049896 [Stylosanthes scabra]|uniref:Uncharacterized protein n=1 Tax=Stylosanthes scabra TaxID=79078 RepID=A0ABU6XIP8_9FABA|nr:hypothetical protein [Stylosanthes scabra]